MFFTKWASYFAQNYRKLAISPTNLSTKCLVRSNKGSQFSHRFLYNQMCICIQRSCSLLTIGMIVGWRHCVHFSYPEISPIFICYCMSKNVNIVKVSVFRTSLKKAKFHIFIYFSLLFWILMIKAIQKSDTQYLKLPEYFRRSIKKGFTPKITEIFNLCNICSFMYPVVGWGSFPMLPIRALWKRGNQLVELLGY